MTNHQNAGRHMKTRKRSNVTMLERQPGTLKHFKMSGQRTEVQPGNQCCNGGALGKMMSIWLP